MMVFLSWSGERSKAVASALNDWIPSVFMRSVETWMSDDDIDVGARWTSEVADKLESCKFGILCITQDNQTAPWLLFEAGALAKAVGSRVAPYLLGLQKNELLLPLSVFQSVTATRGDTLKLLQSIDMQRESPAGDQHVAEVMDRHWPALEKALNAIPKSETPAKKRPADDMLKEILGLVRGMASRDQDEFQGSNEGRFWRNALDELLGHLAPGLPLTADYGNAMREYLRARKRIAKNPPLTDPPKSDGTPPPED